MKVLKAAAKFAKITAINSTNCASRIIGYQSKEPEELKKYKKNKENIKSI